MTPLFRKFEKSDIDDNVLEHIVEIIHKAQQRRYVDANDAYLRLSIGKACVNPVLDLRFNMTDNAIEHGPLVLPWLVSTSVQRARSCIRETSKRIS